MTPALLCVPNVSEGRDRGLVDRLEARVRGVPGVRLLYASADPDHHRSVFAYLGSPESVLEATRSLAALAFTSIDMRHHRGAHPRLGAVDVVPFVPVAGLDRAVALEVCRRFGRWVGEQGIPVYYYEEAATRPERRHLPDLRRGEYEGLRERLEDPAWAPDEGPAHFHARSGATVTGVRGPLVAFNVELSTDRADVAREIARSIRERNGGLPGVRAIGVALPSRNRVQVAMNLVRPDVTPLSVAFEAVEREARAHGVEIAGSELIGPVPLEALVDVAERRLGLRDLARTQIVELAAADDPSCGADASGDEISSR